MNRLSFRLCLTIGLIVGISASFLPNVSVNAEPAESLTDGLIGWWKFNDGTDSLVDDSSVNNFGGTLNNMAPSNYVSTVPAVCSSSNENAISFNPEGQEDEQWIHVGDHEELRPDSVTVAAWINTDLQDTGNMYHIAGAAGLSPFSGGTFGYQLIYITEGGFFDDDLLAISVGGEKSASATVEGEYSIAGAWHHIAGTYDETTGDSVLYIDGEVVGTEDGNPGAIVHTDSESGDITYDFEIARLQGLDESTFSYFEGLLDDVRVYNRALDAEEVASLSEDGDCVASEEDGDGVSVEVEDSAPNNGDANNDGTPDSEQSNVVSMVDEFTGKYATLALDEECTIESFSIDAERTDETGKADTEYNYPTGLMDFTIDCGTPGFVATISQYYYGVDDDDFIVRKYNPTTKEYFTVADAVISLTTIDGNTVTLVTYQVTDGGALDLDGEANGVIVDPAGLAQVSVSSPDTGLVSQSSSLHFIAFIAGFGILLSCLYRINKSNSL